MSGSNTSQSAPIVAEPVGDSEGTAGRGRRFTRVLKDNEKLRIATHQLEIEKRNPLTTFDAFGMQKRFLRDFRARKYRGYLLLGGYRSGKTEVAAFSIVEKMTTEKVEVSCVTVNEKLSIKNQQRKINKLIPQWAKEGAKYNYTQEGGYVNQLFSCMSYTGKSQCNFMFYSQQEDSIQGFDSNLNWYDEEITLSDFDLFDKRLWDHEGHQWVMSAISRKGMTPLLERLMSNAVTIKTRHAKYINEDLPVIQENRDENIGIYYLWTLDNPNIARKDIKARIPTMSDTQRRVDLYGIPKNLSGQCFPMYDEDVHVIPDLANVISVYPQQMLLVAVDPHSSRPWAIGWNWYDPRRSTHDIVREWPTGDFRSDDSPTFRTVKMYVDIIKMVTREVLQQRYNDVIYLIDPKGGKAPQQGAYITQTFIQMLQEYELDFEPAPVGEKGSLEVTHEMVKEALVIPHQNEQISDKNKPRMRFDELCRNFRKAIANHNYDHMEDWKDFVDLCRFFVAFDERYSEREEKDSSEVATITGKNGGFHWRG